MASSEKLRVPLEKIYIGFIIAEDIYKDRDVKLISKDTLMTERLYLSLKKHGIRNIYIYKK